MFLTHKRRRDRWGAASFPGGGEKRDPGNEVGGAEEEEEGRLSPIPPPPIPALSPSHPRFTSAT